MGKENTCKAILILTDFCSLCCSFIITFSILSGITHNITQYIPSDQIQERMLIHFCVSLVCILWFWLRLRHYTYRKPFWFELKEIIRTLMIVAVVELATIAFSKFYFSRYLWVLTWGIALVLVPLGRIMLKKWLIKTKLYLKDTIIIGGGKNAVDAYKALSSESYLGFKIKYFIAQQKTPELEVLGVPILIEDNNHLWELVTKKTDQFVLALEDEENILRDNWLRLLSTKLYRSVSVIPTLRGLPLYSTDMSFIFSYDVILLRINHNLAKRSSRMIKRTVDIVLALIFIILLSPLFAYLYFRIKQDGGNAIYGHSRIGRNGKPFKCLKFRSMVVNSEQVLGELLANDPEANAEWQRNFKLKNDPRLTDIGKYLRQKSLDELPQLFNVLKGDMSLVGPRPIVQQELERYQGNVDYYLMAKPGMTGLWQVSGRNDVDYATRVYFDAWYVKNWSLWTDFVILFKTITVLKKHKGAY